MDVSLSKGGDALMSKVPGDVQKITSSASIHGAEDRTQNITINIG